MYDLLFLVASLNPAVNPTNVRLSSLFSASNQTSISLVNYALPVPNPNRYDSLLIAQNSNLTGVWNCDDGGIYFVRQVGNQVWWYGQSSDGGESWSNVFQGNIRGDQIVGSWADVPKGEVRGSGEMSLQILNADRFVKVSGGENFGGGVWSR